MLQLHHSLALAKGSACCAMAFLPSRSHAISSIVCGIRRGAMSSNEPLSVGCFSHWQAAVLLARWWLPEPIMHRLIMRLEAKREALSSPVRRQPLHSPNNTNGIRHGWLSLNCRNANKRARAYSGVGRAARTGIVPCVVFSVITTKLPAEGQTLTEPGGAGAGCPGQCSISSRTNLYGRSCSPASCSGSKEWLLKDDLCDDPGTTSSPPSPGLTSSR
jgi:hypothetical protein